MNKERLQKLRENQVVMAKSFKEKVENMSSFHILTNTLSTHEIAKKIVFEKSPDSLTCGMHQAGDWNEGFKEIKEGLLKYANIHLKWAEEELK